MVELEILQCQVFQTFLDERLNLNWKRVNSNFTILNNQYLYDFIPNYSHLGGKQVSDEMPNTGPKLVKHSVQPLNPLKVREENPGWQVLYSC